MDNLLPHQIDTFRKVTNGTIKNEKKPDYASLKLLESLGLIKYQATDDNGIIFCSVTGQGQIILAELNKPWYQRHWKQILKAVFPFITIFR